MRGEHFYGRTRTNVRKSAAKSPQPFERRGIPDTGRIARLCVGQGHGFIRLTNDREVYFHRADVQPGTSINDLAIGDTVAFERLDDAVSGGRALRVRFSVPQSHRN